MTEKIFVHENFIYKDECSYDVHNFKYSSQKKILISLCFVIVFIYKWETFMATGFESFYVITALLFKDLHSFAWYIFERTLGTI